MQLHTVQSFEAVHGLPRDAEIRPLVPGLRVALVRLAAAARAAWQAWRTATPAAGLSGHMLRDIGVDRFHVRAPLPAWHALYHHI